jgi:hypothetical protein
VDGTLVIGCPGAYVFDVVSSDGTVIRVQRTWEPVKLSGDARTFYTQMMQWPVPSSKPAYSRLIVDPVAGRIWVRPEVHPDSIELTREVASAAGYAYSWIPGSSGVFDVFDSTGIWIASVRMPSELEYDGYSYQGSVRIRGDTIWARTRNEFKVEYVSKYLVNWPGKE